MKNKIIVTGGAGFIGSHTYVELVAAGYDPIIIDNFSNSDKVSIDGIQKILNIQISIHEADCLDEAALDKIFRYESDILGVIHFAAFKSVAESEKDPMKYYKNILGSLISVINVMNNLKVRNLVFSSSATVYGEADTLPVSEDASFKKAESAYGDSKQMCEQIIRNAVKSNPKLNAVLLRYFNPVGAHPSGFIGEMPLGKPENLVPYITQTAVGKRGELVVFGDDYNTPDGTCIRDYIHVVDLAKAHVKSIDWLKCLSGNESVCEAINIGTGEGNSVLELIQTFEQVNEVNLSYCVGDRRVGDIESSYADCKKAQELIGWRAERNIEDALKDAWNWEMQLAHKSKIVTV